MFRTSACASKTAAVVLAALVVGTAGNASARPRKQVVVAPTATTTSCYGTPVIMQGLDCPARPGRGVEPRPATKRGEHPRIVVRGSSGGYVAPLPQTPLLGAAPTTGPYIPPPVSNPSAQIMQLNQSFPFYRGVGNNPADRDSYLRYNLTR